MRKYTISKNALYALQDKNIFLDKMSNVFIVKRM